MEYIFWCAKCLANGKEGIEARVHPNRQGEEKPQFIKVTTNEYEMACPVCGSDDFKVNIIK